MHLVVLSWPIAALVVAALAVTGWWLFEHHVARPWPAPKPPRPAARHRPGLITAETIPDVPPGPAPAAPQLHHEAPPPPIADLCPLDPAWDWMAAAATGQLERVA